MVRFERRNLQDAVYPRGFDLILCRNVLIYFDRTGREKVIHRLADSLVAGGYLFLGYSETLRDFERHFEVIRTDEGSLYRKQVAAGSPAVHVGRLTREPDPAETSRPRALGRNSRAAPPRVQTRPGVAAPPQDAPPPPDMVVVQVRGEFGDGSSSVLAALLQPALGSSAPLVIVDLEGSELLSDAAARVLGRARRLLDAEGRALSLVARRQAVVRWIKRHGLDGGVPVAADAAEAQRAAAARGKP